MQTIRLTLTLPSSFCMAVHLDIIALKILTESYFSIIHLWHMIYVKCTIAQIGKFVVRRREIVRAVLMSFIYFQLNFINLPRAFYKLSNLNHSHRYHTEKFYFTQNFVQKCRKLSQIIMSRIRWSGFSLVDHPETQ